MSRTVTLTYPARPWTANMDAGRSNRWRKGERVKEWRGAFHMLAVQARVPKLGPIEVTVHIERRNRANWPDVGAHHPAAKAAIDGVVDAGVLPDDDPAHVVRIIHEAPTVTGRDALTLVLREVTPDTTGPRALR